MVKHQDLSVAELCHQLRQIEHGAQEMLLPVLKAESVRTNVQMLGAAPIIAGFEQDEAAGRLVIGQPHLFFKPVPPLVV